VRDVGGANAKSKKRGGGKKKLGRALNYSRKNESGRWLSQGGNRILQGKGQESKGHHLGKTRRGHCKGVKQT